MVVLHNVAERVGAELSDIVRKHWGIESLHWMLDVVFSEDDTRVLSENGLKTMNIMRKFALSLWKQFIALMPQKTKPSDKKQMLQALLSPNTLVDALGINNS